MNRRASLVLSFAVTVTALACGSRVFPGDTDAGPDAIADFDAILPDVAPPKSDAGDGGCTNLQCNVDACDGAAPTTITGTVYDPAGAFGLYGIFVYVPNAPLAPLTAGSPTCSACQAPASGQPIIGGFTDSHGKFTIAHGTSDAWGVPSGDNIPLVIQAGKWRKQLVIPHVDACTTLDLDTIFNAGTGTPQEQHTMRLPSKSSEGDMPLMAFTSGYDPAECFLLHIGIDPSEFVPPTSTTGHVHFYTGQSANGNGYGSQITGGDTPLETYQWWSDHAQLLKYDIVFNACEGAPNGRIPKTGGVENPYDAMDEYLKGGGRLFATHYYQNWFTTTNTPDLQTAAKWHEWDSSDAGAGEFETENVDTSFPKGQAYAEWLLYTGASTALGQISLTDTRDDVISPAPTGCSTKSGTCYSTQWLTNLSDGHPRYISFNTPVNVPNPTQCGRAVFSDVHLSGTTNGKTFPDECKSADPNYATNERALEFLFFDLASCIQDDGQNPVEPPH